MNAIEYQNLKNSEILKNILQEKGIKILLDVRSKPYSKKYAFNKKKLALLLPAAGIQYEWAGRTLGWFSKIDEADIKKLAFWQKEKVVCLMCMEANPDQCHRKNEIAYRLKTYGAEVHHITT